MSGINMLMKSMGIDPTEIQNSITMFGNMVIDLKAQMDRIENKLDAVLAETNSGEVVSPDATGDDDNE